MSDRIDVILDKCLARLKSGESVEACLRDYPEQRAELEPLLLAADCLNAIPEITVTDEFRRTSQARLLARIRSEPKPAPAPRLPVAVFNRLARVNYRPLIPATLIAFLLLIIWFGGTTVKAPSAVPSIDTTRFILSTLSGKTEVRAAGVPEWQEAANATELTQGTEVRTSAGAYAVLTFFDGSTVALDPDTEVEVKESSFSNMQSAQILLAQFSGKTWNNVIGTGNEKPDYRVQTPLIMLSAQGTSFSSEVTVTGATKLTVIEGSVKVTDRQNTEASVAKDQQLFVENNLIAAAPTNITAGKNELALSLGLTGISSICAPNGASTGYLPNGVTFNQIPNSKVTLTADEQRIQIQEPLPGEYTITVRPIVQEETALDIQLVQNDKTTYQNKLVLPATKGEGWTVSVHIAATTSVSQTTNTVSVKPLIGKAPETVVQMPLAVQRATAISTAATASPTSISKTTTGTTKATSTANPVTAITKPAITATTMPNATNVLPQPTVTATTDNLVVTTPAPIKTPTTTPVTKPTTTTPAVGITPPTTTKTTAPASNGIK